MTADERDGLEERSRVREWLARPAVRVDRAAMRAARQLREPAEAPRVDDRRRGRR